MGFDLRSVFDEPPAYVLWLLGLGLCVAAWLVRGLVRRHRNGSERVSVRLTD